MAGDPQAEIPGLRTALRDLVALSTIPAAWVGREPSAIAAGLADVLIEADLEPTAYGYRPGRAALEAVQEVHRALCASDRCASISLLCGCAIPPAVPHSEGPPGGPRE